MLIAGIDPGPIYCGLAVISVDNSAVRIEFWNDQAETESICDKVNSLHPNLVVIEDYIPTSRIWKASQAMVQTIDHIKVTLAFMGYEVHTQKSSSKSAATIYAPQVVENYELFRGEHARDAMRHALVLAQRLNILQRV